MEGEILGYLLEKREISGNCLRWEWGGYLCLKKVGKALVEHFNKIVSEAVVPRLQNLQRDPQEPQFPMQAHGSLYSSSSLGHKPSRWDKKERMTPALGEGRL